MSDHEYYTDAAYIGKEDQSEMVEHMTWMADWASVSTVILELGCGHGNGSTRAFARGLRRLSLDTDILISVDIDPAKPQVRPKGINWTIIHGSTTDANTVFKVLGVLGARKPDLIYIDTEHTKEQMAQELALWHPITDSSTNWLFHDTYMWGHYNPMTDAIKEFAEAHGMTYHDVTRKSHGMGMMFTAGPEGFCE